jgi:rubrerythrin
MRKCKNNQFLGDNSEERGNNSRCGGKQQNRKGHRGGRHFQKWMMGTLLTSTALGFSPDLTASSQAVSTPNSETVKAMVESIEDEYKARAFYQAVIDKFGEVRPFSNIVHAEARHAEMWKSIFTKYGLEVPPDNYAGNTEAPESLKAACEAGIEGEIANVEMYDNFLTFVKEPDIRAAIAQLRMVSKERHLPAFQRCARRLSN